ncbi:M23 family metallopeptidase [Candidatus Uhrbacteria bacterium]|nr:M23 family metallopeptidase [Candidatus Uhrbacteria bacterium]
MRLKSNRLALPTRGLVLHILTNRYAFHAVIAILAVLTAFTNLQARQAHAQDVGQQSLLFALATDQKNEIVEETVRPEMAVKNSNYLGTQTLINMPHVDFDYDPMADGMEQSLVVPGTIAAQPLPDTEESTKPRTKTENYTVQENDTISTIAQRFGVNVGTLLWNNNLQERQYIKPGDVLRIPPVSGMLVKVKSGDTLGKLATRYSGDQDEIANFNNIAADEPLQAGAELMIPGGKPPEIAQTQTQIAVRAKNQVTEPKPSSVKKPADLDTKELPKTKMLWPTSGHVITQYFGWKHIGLDVDGDYSSPLYSAADGVVEKAEWSNAGYGLMILIRHDNSTQTRYGHASKIFVKKGDTVKRGQVIAMMGTTGRSTGTHLHFEVIINGKRVNPLGYIR